MNVVTQVGEVSFNGEHWCVLAQYRRKEDLAGMVRGFVTLHFECEEGTRKCLPGWRFD